MITFIDEKGTEHSALVAYSVTNAVNGELSVKGTIYTNDKVLHGIDRGWRFRLDDEYYRVTYAKPNDTGRQIEVEFDAVHQFFYDMSKSMVYDTLNGSKPFETYLQAIFSGSGYTYNLETTVGSIRKENFGNKSRLSLFNDIIKAAGLEFSVRGHVVRILKRIGTDLSAIVRKDFNMNELKIEKNINSFVTYQRGLGAWKDDEDHSKGRYESEYESPLAKIYGRIEAEPVVDERYKETGKLLERLKENVDKSYKVSVEIDMEDLSRAGYRLSRPNPGDYIMAINETLGFRQKVRIVSFTSEYDVGGNLISRKVICNDIGSVQRQASEMSSLARSVQDVAAENAKAIATATKALVSADGKNTIYFSESKPRDEPVGTLRKGDQLYLKEGEKTNLYFWNGAEWELNPLEMDLVKFRKEYESKTKEINQSMTTQNQQTAQALRTAGANASAIEAAKGAITKLNQDLMGAKQTNQATIDRLKSDFASAQKVANDQTALLKSDLANIRTQQTVYEQTNSQNMSRIVGQIDDKASKSEVNQTADRIREEIASLSVGENLFINSEFKNLRDSGQRYTANGKTYQNMIAPYWYNPYNAGLPNAQNIQHGYFDTETSSETVFAFNESDGSRHWKALSTDFKIGVITSGEYYFSADLYATDLGTHIKFGFYYHNSTGKLNFYAGQTKIEVTEKGRWVRLGAPLKVNDDIDLTKKVQFYIYGYNFASNSILYLKKPKVSKGRLKSDWSPALEDVDGLITEAKSTFERTAQGLRTDLSAIQSYVNADGARAEALQTYSREETARQLTAERKLIEAGYVGKAQHTEDVRSISRRFEELAVGGRNLMGVFNTKPVKSTFEPDTYRFTAKTTQNTTRPTLMLQFRWTDGSYSAVITISETGQFARKFKITKPYSELRVKFNCNKEDAVLLFTGRPFIEQNTDYYFTGDLINLSPNDSQADFLKIEKATITSDWSPAPEDAKNYADTKLAEYKQDINGQLASVQAALNTANGSLTNFNNWKQSAQETLNKVGRVETGLNENKASLAEFKRTAEGQLTTITQQVAGKANQTEFQRIQETSKLYERLIGSTEKEVTDKVSRMALTNELFQVEVSKNLGLRTVQYQIANAWAVQNLDSNGDIVSQINATGPNVRIQGESIHLDGKALIDNGIIKNAMIESMLADKITAGTLNAANVNIINLNANKIVGLDANFIKSKIELALVDWLKGKVITAQNDAMKIDLNNGQYNVMTDQAAIRRVLNGYPNQFLKFTSETEGGAPASVTVLGANRDGTENSKNDSFAGIRLFSGNKVERTEIISDVVQFATGAVNYRGWEMRTLYGNDNRQVILQPFGNVTRSNIVANYFNGIDLVNVLETLNQMMANLGNHTGRHDIFGPIRGLGARKYAR